MLGNMLLGRRFARVSVALVIVGCSGSTQEGSKGTAGDASTGSGGSGATAGSSGAPGGSGGSTSSGGSGGSAASAGTGAAPGTGGAAGVGGAGAGGGSGSGGISGSSGIGGSFDADAQTSCSDAGSLDASSVEQAIAESCVIAIVQVARLDEECSGAGGTHVTFAVLEMGRGSSVTAPTHGGHAYYPQTSGPDQINDIFVAGIDPYGSLVARPDNPGWCITGLPPADGYAHTLLAATDLTDARTKMQAILSM